MTKLSTYYGHGEFDNRRAHVYHLPLEEKVGGAIISVDNFAAQAWDGSTSFRLGEFSTEEQAEIACEDYVLGVKYE